MHQVAGRFRQFGQALPVRLCPAGGLRVHPVSSACLPYQVGVDGWGLTTVPTAGLPSQPESIAAAPTRQALVDAGGTIWQLSGGTWVTLVRGSEPRPGSAPFYPM